MHHLTIHRAWIPWLRDPKFPVYRAGVCSPRILGGIRKKGRGEVLLIEDLPWDTTKWGTGAQFSLHCRNPKAAQPHKKLLGEQGRASGAEFSQHPSPASTARGSTEAFPVAGMNQLNIQSWGLVHRWLKWMFVIQELSNSLHTRRFSDGSITLIHCTLSFPGKSAALYTFIFFLFYYQNELHTASHN